MKKSTESSPLKIAFALAFLFPLINVLLFRGLGLFFLTEPLKYPSELSDALAFVYETFGSVASFFAPLCIMYALIARRKVAGAVFICALSVPLVYAVMLVEDAVINSVSISSAGFRAVIIDTFFVYVAYAVAMLAVYFVRSAKKNAPREIELFSVRGSFSCGAVICTAVTWGVAVLQRGLETYTLIKDRGTPENASEVMELASPYIVMTVCSLFAYIVTCFIISRAECSHKSPQRSR